MRLIFAVKQKFIWIMRRLRARIFTQLVSTLKPSFSFQFHDFKEFDGTGAQLQRLFALMGFCQFFGFSYKHSPILNVTTHPLDSFQSLESKSEYLQRLNSLISVSDFGPKYVDVVHISIKQLRLNLFIFYAVKSFLLRKTYAFRVFEIYPVSDLFPEIYLFLPNMPLTEAIRNRREDFRSGISVHYRQGVGGFVLFGQQQVPREIPTSYFIRNLLPFLNSNSCNSLVTVYTDAPEEDSLYTIEVSQISKWQDTPGYQDGCLEIQANSLSDFSELPNVELLVVRGGDPIDAIIGMAASSTLLIGKSSLSYVAGILNRDGVVIYHPQFWHPPLPRWTRGSL